MADEAECKMPAYREQCHKQCTEPFQSYKACVARVEKKGYGDCEPWYFDYLKCVDVCSVPKIMKDTK